MMSNVFFLLTCMFAVTKEMYKRRWCRSENVTAKVLIVAEIIYMCNFLILGQSFVYYSQQCFIRITLHS